MKRIFTLLAVAAMAVTASAQGSVVPPSVIVPITPGDPTETKNYWDMTALPTNGQRVMDVPGIIVTLGGQFSANGSAETSDVAEWKELKKKAFTQGDVKFTNYANSNDNARNINGGASGNLPPVYNGFGKYVPTKPGKITIYFYVPDTKSVRFLEVNSPANNVEGTNLLLGENPRAKIYMGEGEDQKEIKLGDYYDANKDQTIPNVPQVSEKGVGILVCDLKPGNTYYLALDGSKLGLGGFIYEVDAQNGLDAIVADENAPVEYYNLQGVRVANPENGLYIKRQGSKVEKVVL